MSMRALAAAISLSLSAIAVPAGPFAAPIAGTSAGTSQETPASAALAESSGAAASADSQASAAPVAATGAPAADVAGLDAASAGAAAADVASTSTAGAVDAKAAGFSSDNQRPTGSVTVTATGVRVDQGGNLLVMLFRGADGWLKNEQAFARVFAPAAAESVTVAFAAVPYDSSYAVEIIHDRNGNSKLDMRIFPFPKPKEGAGVSRNHTRMGKPQYEPARFAVADSLTALRVIMRY